jgi:ABC-type multidrug transport system fused ATPase/permease subunit
MRVQQSLIQIQSSASISRGTFEMLAELEKMEKLASPDVEIQTNSKSFNPFIRIDSLSFSYSKSSETVIENLNLEIKEGESFGLVGLSGSGKSTLADLMLGVLDPTSGTISVSGLDPRSALRHWPGKVGYVPQDVQLIEGTIKENIQFGDVLPYGDAQILEIVRLCQLSNLVTQSEDLNLEVGENGSRLSGGQRQRLGIARAMYTNPKLLILDEISSALDAETESSLVAVLEELRSEVTVVLIAHRLSTVRNCDRIAYLEKGRLLGIGTFQELRIQVPEFDNQARLMGL